MAKSPGLAAATKAIAVKDYSKACKLLRKYLRTHPKSHDALHSLGVSEHFLGNNEKAIEHLKRANEFSPENVQILNDIGVVYSKIKDYENAAKSFAKALELLPEFIDSLNGLATSLMELGDNNGAIACAKKVIALDENNCIAYNVIGTVLRRDEQYHAALQCYSKSYEINSEQVSIHNLIGITLGHLGRYEEASAFFVEGLKLDQNSYQLYNNYADVLKMQGKYVESKAAYQLALGIWPDDEQLRWNLSHTLLAMGDLNKGWENYECGLNTGARGTVDFHVPVWDGVVDLSDKVVAISAEQGVGDELLFANCFRDILGKAKTTIISCDYRLKDIFQESFPSAIIYPARNIQNDSQHDYVKSISLPKVDCQIYSGSLPKYFRPNIQSFPKDCGYLHANDSLVSEWEMRVQNVSEKKLKVGVVWRSGLQHVARMRHYVTLRDMGEILRIPGIEFFNLQYDDCFEEISEIRDEQGVDIKYFDNLDYKNDFNSVSALIRSLDLVIGAGTAVTALSGALGVPTITYSLHGNWLSCGTNYLPWFPCTKIFYKDSVQGWSPVMTNIADELNAISSEIL